MLLSGEPKSTKDVWSAKTGRSDKEKHGQFSLTNDATLIAFFGATLGHSKYDTVNIESDKMFTVQFGSNWMIWCYTLIVAANIFGRFNKAHGNLRKICRYNAQCGAVRQFLIL